MADMVDRSAQVDTRALLDLSQAVLRAVADMASDGILSIDTRGDIIAANRAAERIFGYGGTELAGRPLTDLLPEGLRVSVRDTLAQLMTALPPPTRTMEILGLRKNGDEFPLALSLTLCRSGAETILAAVLRDIEWRTRVERELAAQRTHLEATNEELEAFSYSVSHDLRAPLRSIQGFSRVLLLDHLEHLPADGRDALQRICAATERMERLIDAMLSLSRVTRSELHEDVVDLSAIVRAVIADLQKHDPARRVEVTIEDGLAATGDTRLLRAVFENLLDNAWKATATRDPGRIEFGVTWQHGDCEFFVRDNGLGFDTAYAHKLFSPFQTLHRRVEFPGTGVGLATVQRIVKRHGGSVRAVGEPGHGAVFFVGLRRVT